MATGQNNIVKDNILPPKSSLPYDAPYGYFEHLPHRLQQRMNIQPANTGLGLAPWVWLSMGMMVVIAAWFFWQSTPHESDIQNELSALSEESIGDYLLTHNDPPALMVMAEYEQIQWPWKEATQAWSDNELLQWVDEADILNAMEEL